MWNLAPYIRNILLYKSSFRSVPAKNKPYSRKNLVSENHIRGRQCTIWNHMTNWPSWWIGHIWASVSPQSFGTPKSQQYQIQWPKTSLNFWIKHGNPISKLFCIWHSVCLWKVSQCSAVVIRSIDHENASHLHFFFSLAVVVLRLLFSFSCTRNPLNT